MDMNPIRIEATRANLSLARRICLAGWRERAAERGSPEPVDLSGSCKFTSMFAAEIFGGEMRGNEEHQFCQLAGGRIIDLNHDAADVQRMEDPHVHDPGFWGNPDHAASLESCRSRVGLWVSQFLQEMGKTMASDPDEILYHVTAAGNLAEILSSGLRPGSYWGRGEIAGYYAETVEDEGAEPVVLCARLADLVHLAPEPDHPGIAEPLTHTLGMNEEAVREAWSACGGSWQDSLAIIGSLRVADVVPPDTIFLEDEPSLEP